MGSLSVEVRTEVLCGHICDLEAENAKLREELESVGTAAYLYGRSDLKAENAKLRELCATVIDDWMSKVCPTFPFCGCGGEYESCTDESCGNQIYRQMARELGVEVGVDE